MTYFEVITATKEQSDAAEIRGPLIGVDLPDSVAQRLAAGRPVLAVNSNALPELALSPPQDAVVGCMLLGQPADALDVIGILSGAGYLGPVTVVAPPLPNPGLVLRELRRAGRNISVTMVEA